MAEQTGLSEEVFEEAAYLAAYQGVDEDVAHSIVKRVWEAVRNEPSEMDFAQPEEQS